jgi:tetratricopeptide (TPR) repeat protein
LSPYTTAQLYEGLCLYELGQGEEAHRVLEPLVLADEGPTVPWAPHGPHALLALTLVDLGQEAGARDVAALIDPVASPFAAAVAALGLGDVDRAAQWFARADRLTAWPCLLVHHYLDRIWSGSGASDQHRSMRQVALRSWNVQAPSG